jgi:hypothetical protein
LERLCLNSRSRCYAMEIKRYKDSDRRMVVAMEMERKIAMEMWRERLRGKCGGKRSICYKHRPPQHTPRDTYSPAWQVLFRQALRYQPPIKPPQLYSFQQSTLVVAFIFTNNPSFCSIKKSQRNSYSTSPWALGYAQKIDFSLFMVT